MPQRHSACSPVLFALAAVLLTTCSGRHSIDADEARSAIRSVRSLAAETELFIEVVLQGRTTRRYAEIYPVYLEEQAKESAAEIESGSPEADAVDLVRVCRTQLDLLAREISAMRAARGDAVALRQAGARIRIIRERIEKATMRP